MNKHYTTIAALLLILFGCTREQAVPVSSQEDSDIVETEEVKASIESLDTRTSYANTSGTFSWSASDKIRLHLSDNTQQFLSILSSSGSTATFIYSKKPGTVTRNGYALYPANPDDASQVATDVSSSPVVRLPAAYTVSDITSAGLDAELPLIAVNTEGSNLTFRHVAGLLRIRCDNVPAGTQTLVLTFDGRQVTGAFPVTNPATDAPSISTTTASGGNNVVTFTVHSTGLTAAANNVFLNVPLPCGAYTSFTVEAKNSSSTVLETKTQLLDKTVTRGNGYVSLVTFPVSAPAYIEIDYGGTLSGSTFSSSSGASATYASEYLHPYSIVYVGAYQIPTGSYSQYVGIGNDYILIDDQGQPSSKHLFLQNLANNAYFRPFTPSQVEVICSGTGQSSALRVRFNNDSGYQNSDNYIPLYTSNEQVGDPVTLRFTGFTDPVTQYMFRASPPNGNGDILIDKVLIYY